MVGYFGEWTHSKEKMFCDLLRLSALRGPHSTGVAVAGVNGASGIVKEAVLPDQLMKGKAFLKITNAGWYNCYIGHNRWATTGAVNEANAHPFNFKTLMGCHNGTLHSRFDLVDGAKFDTDSEAIFYNIDRVGLRDTYKELRGAVALVWWNKKRKTLNFIRNQHRPLVYAWTKSMDGIMWASEGWMIDVAAERNKVEHGKIYDTGIHKHYEMTLSKKKITIKKKKVKPFKMPVYVAPPFTEARPYLSGFGTAIQEDKHYRPFGLDQNGTSSTDEAPMVGRSYSLYPRNIIKSYCPNTKGEVESFTIICGFQNLHKKYVAKIQIFDTKDHWLAELYPDSQSLYSKLFYKGRVSHSYPSLNQGEGKVFIISCVSVEVIVPRDCKRRVKGGEMLGREAFDDRYKDCGFCGDPLCFEDDVIEFSDKQDDLAICGKCSDSFDMQKEGL